MAGFSCFSLYLHPKTRQGFKPALAPRPLQTHNRHTRTRQQHCWYSLYFFKSIYPLLLGKAPCLQRRRGLARREFRFRIVRITMMLMRLCRLPQPAPPGSGPAKARLAPRRRNGLLRQLRTPDIRGRRHDAHRKTILQLSLGARATG